MVVNGRPYIFQKDFAPAYKARTTQANMPYHWLPNLWPPSLSDCNPLNCFVWGISESKVNSRFYNNNEALKAAIRDAMINMDRNAIAKACSSFQSYLEKVVAADGDHHLLLQFN